MLYKPILNFQIQNPIDMNIQIRYMLYKPILNFQIRNLIDMNFQIRYMLYKLILRRTNANNFWKYLNRNDSKNKKIF